tara:strand:+ start:16405 stop:18144 length:1740 start_codon:yes stop_codon:yes gene_type:complete
MKNPSPTFRPPMIDESALHYCENIAQRNGWQSVNQLLTACGQKPIHNWNKPSGHIESALKAITMPYSFRESVNFTALQPLLNSQKQPKICLECIDGSLPHLVSNQLAINTHCDIHQSPLLDKCGSCGAKIKSSIHRHCVSCYAPLMNEVYVHDDYFLFASTLGDEKALFLENLLELAVCFIRPWDILHEPTNWATLDNMQITALMGFAFQFLTTEHGLTQYSHKLYTRHLEHLAIVQELLDEKVIKVEKLAMQCEKSISDPLPSVSCSLLFNYLKLFGTALGVSSKRAQLINDAVYKLETHCSAGQLAKMLGIRTNIITQLIHEKVFRPLNDVNIVSKMIFCIKASLNHIKSYLPQVAKRQKRVYVSLVNISDTALAAYGIDKSDIIFAALRQEIPACFNADSGKKAGQFSVESDALLDFLNWNKGVDDHISIDKFAKRLMVPIVIVEKLLKECEDLHYAKYLKVGQPLIDQAAAESFLTNYICLNREAWLYGIPMNDVRNILETCCDSETSLVFEIAGPKQEFVFFKANECTSRNLPMIFDDIPYRVFIHKYGRKNFPSIMKSLSVVETLFEGSEHAL